MKNNLDLRLALWTIAEAELRDDRTLDECQLMGYPLLALGQIYQAKYRRVPGSLSDLIRLVQYLQELP